MPSSTENHAARRAQVQAALAAFTDTPLHKISAILMDRAIAAIAAQFERKNAGNLFSGRGGKLTDAGKQVKSTGDFELITWLVIKQSEGNAQ